jgi:hypothetical protein
MDHGDGKYWLAGGPCDVNNIKGFAGFLTRVQGDSELGSGDVTKRSLCIPEPCAPAKRCEN